MVKNTVEKQPQTLQDNHRSTDIDADGNVIAICGMALRLPGKLSTPEELWGFLMSKQDAKAEVPESRYAIESYYSGSLNRVGMTKTKYGYFLDQSIDLGAIDSSFFSFTRNELEFVDPQQRQLLEIVRECFESAGEVNYRGANIGCYIGSFGDDWTENLFHDPQMYGKYPLMIGNDFSLSNRISFEYDLRGPSMSIRTACSSGIICLHEACNAIQRGECSSAIIGSSNLMLSPSMSIIMSAKGILAADGSCKSFDAAADGYGRAEGINAIYVKPLKEALRDGNPIRAVIRGTAVNCDGKLSGASTPSAVGQEALIRKAYAAAGIEDISQTPFFECHGTGTPVGDPIEVSAIANAIGTGTSETYIGSVKPNVGHSEGASGLTSLIKVVMALENETIPPNINFNVPNPNIPFNVSKIRVPVDPLAWPKGRPLRASVNSFGMGGTNAHAILEAAKKYLAQPSSHPSGPSQTDEPAPTVLLFSANTIESLERNMEAHHAYMQRNPSLLPDLAFTLAMKREKMQFRSASIVSPSFKVGSLATVRVQNSTPKLIMVFTGQGAQWPGMGCELYRSSEVYRRTIDGLDCVLQHLMPAPPWCIREEMCKPEEESNLHRAQFAQPVCTAVQIALVDVLRSLGAAPTAVVGHSSGELAAAYAAGRITAKYAFVAAYYRGLISEGIPCRGMMAAVGLSINEVQPFCCPGVVVACENSPSSVTLSGDADKLPGVLASITLSRPDVIIRKLRVNVAYHSHHMKRYGETYRQYLDESVINGTSKLNGINATDGIDRTSSVDEGVLFYSSLTGNLLQPEAALNSQYWQENIESPVRFYQALNTMLSDFGKKRLLFLEIGPHSTLAGPIRQCVDREARSDVYLSCLVRCQNSSEAMLSAIANLFCHGVELDLMVLTNSTGTAKTLPDLPTYRWNRNFTSMYMPRENKEWRWCQHKRHELIGIRVIDSTDDDPSWRNVLHLEHVGWLRDHKVGGVVVFPAAGYLAMVGAALTQISASSIQRGYCVREFILNAALTLTEAKSSEMILSMHRLGVSEWFSFAISSHNGAGWTKHCYGTAKTLDLESVGEEIIQEELTRNVDSYRWYDTLARGGLDYGPAFRAVEALRCSTKRPLAGAKIESTTESPHIYQIHPTKLDAFFQVILCAIYGGLDWAVKELPIPTAMGEIIIGCCASELTVRSLVTDKQMQTLSAEATAWLPNGDVAVRLKGAVLRQGMVDMSRQLGSDNHGNAARLHWQPSVEFSRLKDLIRPSKNWKNCNTILSELTLHCIDEARRRVETQVTSIKAPHLQKYHAWLKRQFCVGPKSDIETIFAKIKGSPAALCANAIGTVLDNIVPIFEGQVQPLEVLMAGNNLTELYNYLNLTDRSALFRILGHNKPRQRILEIGAGTGGTTAELIRHTSYATYTFTDVSSAFFPAAKKRFRQYDSIIYKTLDISKNPIEQGFERGSFDLIVAANVLHATKSLHETLTNVRTLLHPQGKLYLEELSTETTFINFIAGVLPGWWEGESDGRCDQPYVSLARWHTELLGAGFQGVTDAAYDAAAPYHVNAYILSSPITETDSGPKSVTLVCNETCRDQAELLRGDAIRDGYHVAIQSLDESLPSSQDVICLVDLVNPYFDRLDEGRLTAFQRFLDELQRSGAAVLWVTRLSQTACDDPGYGLSVGVARNVRAELQIPFATCEVDQLETNTNTLMRIFTQFSRCHPDRQTTSVEYEYIICEGNVLIGRLLPFSMAKIADPCSPDEDHNQTHTPTPPAKAMKLSNEVSRTGQEQEPVPDCAETSVSFDARGCYLLAGGLGGVGTGLARWMAEHGVRHLVFLSRSAGDGRDDKHLFRELQSMGCTVTAVKGSVTESSDVAAAFAAATAPLKGVFNIAMVLCDQSILSMSLHEWEVAIGPKMKGTMNLHEASLSHSLDFFVLFSSMAGILGLPGQVNYAAANSFMDAFTRYRHGRGLPASVVDVGYVRGIGYVSDNPQIIERLKWIDLVSMSQQDLFNAVAIATNNGQPSPFSASRATPSYAAYVTAAQVITSFPKNSSTTEAFKNTGYFRDNRLAVYTNYLAPTDADPEVEGESKLASFVSTLAGDYTTLSDPATANFIAIQAARWVFDLLLKPVTDDAEIDLSRSLLDIGLDSLAAVELRNWWKKVFGMDISVLEITSMSSLAAIGTQAVTMLTKKLCPDNSAKVTHVT